MEPYLISLVAGLARRLLDSVLGIRSPAPSAVALLGLPGMLIGEQAGFAASRWFGSADRCVASQSAPVGKDLP